MYKVKERFFIIPKHEWYIKEAGCMKEFFKKFNDYEIKECTDEKIKEKIDEYNLKQDIKFFDRLKTEHFYFARTTEITIGKYESGRLEMFDMWRK